MSQVLMRSNFFQTIKKPLVLLALSVISLSAMAEWSYIGGTDSEEYFVDKSTFRGDQLRRGWFLINRNDGSRRYKSEKQLWIADCKNEQVNIIQFDGYSEVMGKGVVVNSQTRNGPPVFTYPPPGSMMETLLNTLCFKKR